MFTLVVQGISKGTTRGGFVLMTGLVTISRNVQKESSFTGLITNE